MSIEKKAEAKLPTHWGDFSVIAYEDPKLGEEHLLLYLGELQNDSLLRIHSQCLTGDALYSLSVIVALNLLKLCSQSQKKDME